MVSSFHMIVNSATALGVRRAYAATGGRTPLSDCVPDRPPAAAERMFEGVLKGV